VQARNPAGPLLLQADAEQVGEQVMVAPPAAHLSLGPGSGAPAAPDGRAPQARSI